MNQFLKSIIIALAIILLAWLLPTIFDFATTQKKDRPFVIYSGVLNDFLIRDSEDKTLFYRDTKGNRYTREQADSLVPTLFYRQLITDSRLPDSLHGVKITPKMLSQTQFFFHHRPQHINTTTVKMYPLLESRSKRVDLSMPDDVCLFTNNRIYFIDMETNRINKEKSERFWKLFKRKEVAFPIKTISGDPTTKKEYDEGYFFTDNKNRLFHFKQMVGTPYLKQIDIDPTIEIKHIFVTEFSAHASFAYLTDKHHKMYVLTAPDYRLVETGIPAFNPEKDNLTIIGNHFDWNVQLSNSNGVHIYALDAKDYHLIDTYSIANHETKWKKIAQYIFPFELHVTSSMHKYFRPQVDSFSTKALFFNMLLALFFYILQRKKKYPKLVGETLVILVLGIFAFIPLIIYQKY